MWNVIGRAKYDAWAKLGDMSQEQAMGGYIEELKKIIETMSFSGDVQEFLDSIGPFYEFVNLEGSEMSHIKEALDAWSSSSSNSSSNNNSPVKINFQGRLANGYVPAPAHSIASGESPEPSVDPPEEPRNCPPAPTHHRAPKLNGDLAGCHRNGNDSPEEEILQIEPNNQHGNKMSVSSIESDRYFSGDSDPEVDIEEKYGRMNAEDLVDFSPGCSNHRQGSHGQCSSTEVLQSTVTRLNRDTEHILARLRILETAYATQGVQNTPGASRVAKRKTLNWIGLHPRALVLVLTWPFVAYFVIRLIRWWLRKRR
jgi:hypothetical protein